MPNSLDLKPFLLSGFVVDYRGGQNAFGNLPIQIPDSVGVFHVLKKYNLINAAPVRAGEQVLGIQYYRIFEDRKELTQPTCDIFDNSMLNIANVRRGSFKCEVYTNSHTENGIFTVRFGGYIVRVRVWTIENLEMVSPKTTLRQIASSCNK